MTLADCLAIHDGETHVTGLDGPITIVRDRWGIPHIRAVSAHDAFFGQGFCLAQDRLWQLELGRHMAHGRTASLLGHDFLGLDVQNRTIGFGRLAKAEWEQQSSGAQATLEAYAAGINAAIETQPLPYEFSIIGHTMQPWSPIDSLAIMKLHQSGQQWASKLKYGQIAASLGAAAVSAAISAVPHNVPVIVPSGARWTGEPHPFDVDIERAMGEPDGTVAAGGGSNCWVIHGSRTTTGAPLVAGDPHLGLTIPGPWYIIHMECPEFKAAGTCNPGYPGPIFYGHNTHVAWTMTHTQGDRWDIYRERVRSGSRGPEYLFRGTWEPFTRGDETFTVRDSETETHPIWSTGHGPVIFGNPESDDEVLAARWGLADAAHDIDALLTVILAKTAAEARTGFRQYDSVSGNFCFADTNGDIGYQYAGRIPKRPAWLVPVPGWTGEHEWQGDVPKDELPCEENPAVGYLMTANNRTTTDDYPHYLTYTASRFRSERLRELIDATPSFALDDMRRLQSDITSIGAREVTTAILAVPVTDDGAHQLQQLFRDWDAALRPESAAALAYDAICDALTLRTVRAYYDRATVQISFTHFEQRRILLDQLKERSPLMLVQDATWDDAVAAALAEAATTLAEHYGPSPSTWRWDARHEVRWRHNLARQSGLATLLNLAPFGVGGDASTPFCTTSDYDASVMAGVSYRQVLDLTDLNAAQICIVPGNSGQPGSPHYADNVERWRDVKYHPLYINWADIAANAEATLILSVPL